VGGGIDIDRVLDAPVIGGPCPIRARIGVALNDAVRFGDEVRIAVIDERALAPGHFGFVRRLDLERGGAVPHRVIVDAGDGRDVGGRGGADRDG
jgi:hypothetical protein